MLQVKTIAPIPVILFFCAASASAELKGIRKDLDGNGYKEAVAYYNENKTLMKLEIDQDLDGKYETTVHYKNGFREIAEKDTDGDGKSDTWIKYYFTGLPWVISRDRNRDGKADYWRYLKNGFVYKKERDRNFDGAVDLRIAYEGKADLRFVSEEVREYERREDNDFDGVFEKTEVRNLQVFDAGMDPTAGAIEELG